jgi:CBS domain-containing protein
MLSSRRGKQKIHDAQWQDGVMAISKKANHSKKGDPMQDRGKTGRDHVLKIGTVLKSLKGRDVPIISQDSDLGETIDTIARFPHSRLLYVVDNEGRLIGTVSLGNLVRHFFSGSHEPRIHARSLLSMITSETAKDIMERHPIFAGEEEVVEEVLKRMIEKNVKEIAVLDGEERPIGDITMIDLLRLLISNEKDTS